MDVVGVDQEVRQVEELGDQLPDIRHGVSGGRLPLLLHTVEHSLRDIKPSLKKTQRTLSDPGTLLNQSLQQKY